MKAAIVAAVLAAAGAFAAPTEVVKPRQNSVGNFYAQATSTNNSINGLVLQTNGTFFYLGGSGPTTDCPEGLECGEAQDYTVLSVNSTAGTASLFVDIPGGQPVYVSRGGFLQYLEAGEVGEFPSGAITTGFNYYPSTTVAGSFNFAATGTGDFSWVACSLPTGSYAYQVYANMADVSYGKNCEKIGFDAWTYDGEAVGEYL